MYHLQRESPAACAESEEHCQPLSVVAGETMTYAAELQEAEEL